MLIVGDAIRCVVDGGTSHYRQSAHPRWSISLSAPDHLLSSDPDLLERTAREAKARSRTALALLVLVIALGAAGLIYVCFSGPATFATQRARMPGASRPVAATYSS